MARYEFSDGKSDKFWAIDIQDDSLEIRFGRIGTDGQTQTKVFANHALAVKEHDKLVAAKTKKGYVQVTEAPKSKTSGAKASKASAKASKASAKAKSGDGSNAELEAAIEANPDDEQAWLVYADWLQTQGDPRGEIITLMHGAQGAKGAKATKLRQAAEAVIEQHREAWLSEELIDDIKNDVIRVTWYYGAFLKTLRIGLGYDVEGMEMDASLRALFKLPVSRFVQEIVLGLPGTEGEHDYGKALTVLSKVGKRTTVKKLVVGDYEYPDETEISWTDIGNVGKVLPVFPALERLEVQGGGIVLGTLEHENLRRLELRTGGLPAAAVKSVAAAKLPALEHLDVWLGAEDYGAGGNVKQLAELFEGKGYPKLRHLGLKNSEFQNDIAKAIANAPLLRRLSVLDLGMGTMSDEGAEHILSNAKKFEHLEKLSLGDNFLSADAVRRLKAAFGKKVDTGNQQEPDRYDDEVNYYVTVGE